jgi:hypothetical protein
VEHEADRRRGEPSRHRGQHRPRDNSSDVGQARFEALAGKKCGACRRSTGSSSSEWKTCCACTLGLTARVSRSSAWTSGRCNSSIRRDRPLFDVPPETFGPRGSKVYRLRHWSRVFQFAGQPAIARQLYVRSRLIRAGEPVPPWSPSAIREGETLEFDGQEFVGRRRTIEAGDVNMQLFEGLSRKTVDRVLNDVPESMDTLSLSAASSVRTWRGGVMSVLPDDSVMLVGTPPGSERSRYPSPFSLSWEESRDQLLLRDQSSRRLLPMATLDEGTRNGESGGAPPDRW